MTAVINSIFRFFSFFWLTGPVFDKELRISSRRPRNYVLRFAYISLLLTILLFIWIQFIDYQSNDVVQISRMAQTGKFIITCIVWFQFCAAQIIAIVMLSNSISDEIYHKTLGMLMTTPITSMQIVMGKLLSKLLQLILLLAISMPLLAIARLFGGVPWKYVTSSLCITFSTVLFVSSLSLFFSIFLRRSYRVIIVTFLVLFLCFAILPFIFVTAVTLTKAYAIFSERVLLFIVYQPNPYFTFFLNTITMLEPQNPIGSFYSSVFRNCIFTSILSFFILLFSVVMVRKVALRQATGQLVLSRKRKFVEKDSNISSNSKSSSCFSVIGPPVIWKELFLPLRKSGKVSRVISAIISISVLFYSYWFNIKEGAFSLPGIHIVYVILFLILGIFVTLVLSATSITTEKESRAWPLLLSSTLSNNQIIIGKFVGVFSRCLPMWGLLLAHVFYFSIVHLIHPAGLCLIVLFVICYLFFLCSSGIYFSSCFKHTTTAVIMNFMFAVFIWGIMTLFLGIVSSLMENSYLVTRYLIYNPFVQLVVIIGGTANVLETLSLSSLKFQWFDSTMNFMDSLHIFIYSFIIYMTLGFLFLWRAQKRIRRKIF